MHLRALAPKLGKFAFAFFLIKGLLWLLAPVLIALLAR